MSILRLRKDFAARGDASRCWQTAFPRDDAYAATSQHRMMCPHTSGMIYRSIVEAERAMAESSSTLRHRPRLVFDLSGESHFFFAGTAARPESTASGGPPVGADDHLHVPGQCGTPFGEPLSVRAERARRRPQPSRVLHRTAHVLAVAEVGQLHHDLAGGGRQLVGQLLRRGLPATGRDLREQLFEALREQVKPVSTDLMSGVHGK